MHYDFKQKLNKIDSQKYRNLQIPEIDWKLNEAQEVFVKIIAEPRFNNLLGFEVNQRTIDDIRSIVVNQKLNTSDCQVPSIFDESSFICGLPSDYWYFLSAKIYADKEGCKDKLLKKVRVLQDDDEEDLSPFDRSSFEWGEVNIRFINEGIKVFTEGDFTVSKVCINYIKQLSRIHNAQDYQGGSYIALDGVTLSGSQSCELPVGTHREIVDLAVAITSGDLSLPDYMLKQNKLKLVN